MDNPNIDIHAIVFTTGTSVTKQQPFPDTEYQIRYRGETVILGSQPARAADAIFRWLQNMLPQKQTFCHLHGSSV